MIELAAPAFALAGAVLALVPLLLHLLAPAPPEPAPLPTARFLQPDARLRPRLRRRPSDVPLMLLRMLALLLAGLALAQPRWVNRAAGTEDIVLLDRASADSAAARARATAILEANPGADQRLIEFDSGYTAALRSLRANAAASPRDSVRAWLITDLAADTWQRGLAPARDAIWPAGIRVVELPAPAFADSAPAMRVAVLPVDSARYVDAAVSALGGRIVPAAEAQTIFVLADTRLPAIDPGTGATTVVFGGVLPYASHVDTVSQRDMRTRSRLVFQDGTVLDDVEPIGPAPAADGRRVLAVWDDGSPAATSLNTRAYCATYIQTSLAGGSAVASPALPHVVAALAAACEEPAGALVGPGPGAREVLRGAHGTDRVAVRAIAVGTGTPLHVPFVLAALVTLVIEGLLRRRRA